MDLGVGSTLSNVFLPNNNPVDVAKQGCIFTTRTLNNNNQIIVPENGLPVPYLYKPIQLPVFTDGVSALEYLGPLGYQYTLGLTYDDDLPAPDIVTSNPVTGIVTLTWNTAALGLQQLISVAPSGAVTQTNTGIVSTGTIRGIRVEGNQSFIDITLVSGSAAFTTLNTITLNATVSQPVPNPATSDRACIVTWAFYNQYADSAQFATSPTLWISVGIQGRDASISPTATPIVLGIPDAVDVLPDTSVNLSYAIDADNLGLLPPTFLGNTVVTQNTETAIFNGYILTPTECIINVLNPSGAFNDTDSVSVVLDVSQNGGVLSGEAEINSWGLDRVVLDETELTTTYGDFYDLIQSFQSPDTVQQNKFNVKGYYGYAPTYLNQNPISAIVCPDSDAFVDVVRLDIPTALQFPNDAGANMAAVMFNSINNDIPYFETSGRTALINLTGSTNQNTIPSIAILNQLAVQGCTALGVNTDGTIYIYRNQTTLQTNGGQPDNEVRFMSYQQKVTWVDQNIYLAGEASVILPNGQRRNNDPETIKNCETNMLKVLADGVTLKMLGTTNNSVVVTIDPDDVTKLKAVVTTSIISGNSGINTVVYFQSYSI